MTCTHRPTVLVVSQYAAVDRGGAERYREEVSKRLPAHGFNLVDLSVDGSDADYLLTSPIRLSSAGLHWRWRRDIASILDRVAPDLIYAHATVPFLVELTTLAAHRRGIPVCLMHHSAVTGPDPLRRSFAWAYDRSLGPMVVKRISELCVASPEYARSVPLLSRFPSEPVIAPPGVDPVFAGATRHPQPRPYILFVGKADVASKGLIHLYRAWREVRTSWPELDLVIAGSGSGTAYEGARVFGRIESLDALAELYASAEATVLPSLTNAESFGMVLAESLVAGCPVIGSRVGGIPAIIDDDVNGYLVAPGSVSELVDALDRIRRNGEHLRAGIAAAQPCYVARYAWENTAAATAEALWRALNRRPSAA